MASPPPPARRPAWYVILFGIILALIGVSLAIGGVELVGLSGSWYYLIAGAAMAVAGVLLVLGRPAGAWLYALVFVGTVIWAFWEVGSDFWPLVPRVVGPIVLALLTLLIWPGLHQGGHRARVRRNAYPLAGVALLALIGFGVGMFRPQGVIRNDPGAEAASASAPAPVADWQYYGRTPAGTRYAPLTQITPDNVKQLEVAWTFRTGDIADKGAENQNTPTQIGDTVYVCTPRNKVFALDADTGKERWHFDPEASSPVWQRCRGVGYYESAQPVAAEGQPAACRRRIILSTIDARLIALDADTGKPCADFGKNGSVDLKQGMGEVKPGYYFQTSAPTVVRNMIVIGGWVFDNRAVDEPSGAVRAFNADTGELAWAWDMGDPSITGVPPEGKTYTRGTPNVWSTPAFDDELGLIYLPTGNSPPDFWGAHRSKAAEAHASSVVALDIATGRERWTFQTVHHDLWDYDIASQPALYDIPDDKGGVQQALIQVTKRGQIFVLDRATGKPLTEVKELPVPQGAQQGDWTSPTQPYSVGMPSIGTKPFTEASMWGATFFDQLWCRIEFKKMRYEGEFTPPTTQRSLQYPGYYGGMNWGSASVDEGRGYLIVNDIRMPQWIQLIPRGDADKEGAAGVHDGFAPQTGTPYGVSKNGFMSPLGVPCHAPPYGTLSAIDLKSRKLLWQVPMSTLQDTGPLGMKTGLQIPIGMPTLGGPLSTASGLVFYAGTQDYYLRAMDTRNGEELWKARLPVGAQATPMSYVSPKSGKQFVVLSVGGSRQSPDRGDYVIAYALRGAP